LYVRSCDPYSYWEISCTRGVTNDFEKYCISGSGKSAEVRDSTVYQGEREVGIVKEDVVVDTIAK
jgi:hypothetical protein